MAIGLKRASTREYQGVAIADKEFRSRELLVFVPELLVPITGELDATRITDQMSVPISSGNVDKQITCKNFITCTYRNDDPNFADPPDVRKGEQVIVYNYGDANRFYWKSEGRNDNLRRCEVRRISVSGSLENKAQQNDDNTYYFELDTLHHKRIRISTSAVQGEKHRYLIEIDADASQVTISDEIHNMFFIDSEQHQVLIKNTDDSIVLCDKTNIVMACKDNVTIKAENGDVTIYAGKDIQTKSKQNTNLEVGKNYTSTAQGVSHHHSEKSWGVSSKEPGSVSVSHLSIRRS